MALKTIPGTKMIDSKLKIDIDLGPRSVLRVIDLETGSTFVTTSSPDTLYLKIEQSHPHKFTKCYNFRFNLIDSLSSDQQVLPQKTKITLDND